MKLAILPSLAISALFISSYAISQKNTAFAVTASIKGEFHWNCVREIDLSTGEVVRTLYDPAANTPVQLKAVAGRELKTVTLTGAPTGIGVAATAYDAEHNRLYFTSMRRNELMYFDLTTTDLNVVVDENPLFNSGDKTNEANVITRMAFASDGFGYAASNDGKTLLKFTTGPRPTVINMGKLLDGKKNGNVSIYSQSTSWGGDMVGDAYGNLYLITYRNHVFKINPNTRIADHLGQVKGLPAEFTTNGMAVSNEGDVIVTSAVQTDNYYRVDMSSLEAVAFKKKEDKLFNSSDLANSNLLFQNKNSIAGSNNCEKGNRSLAIYPNPVTDNTFSVKFEDMPQGRYNLALIDAGGRRVLSRALNINVKGQVEQISLPKTAGGGLFMIKMTGDNRKAVYNQKFVVQ